MSLPKKTTHIPDLVDGLGNPTKKARLEKAQEALELAKEVAKNKPIRAAPKGESEFSRKLKNKKNEQI